MYTSFLYELSDVFDTLSRSNCHYSSLSSDIHNQCTNFLSGLYEKPCAPLLEVCFIVDDVYCFVI